jgi:hypothetical protein
VLVPGSYAVVIALILFVLNRRTSANWPAAAPTFVSMALVAVSPGMLLNIPAAVTLGLVTWVLSRAAVLIVTKPPTPSLIASAQELHFDLRDSRSRLRIQHDRLPADRLLSRWRAKPGRLAIPLGEVRFVEVGRILVDDMWTMPNGVKFAMSAGTVLRVAGANQQWLLPMSEEDSQVASENSGST